jgi:hypothetical protein
MKYHMRYGTGTGNLLQDGSAIHGVLWAMNPSLTAVGLSTLAFKAYLRPDSESTLKLGTETGNRVSKILHRKIVLKLFSNE